MSEKLEIRRDGAKAQKNSGRGKYQKGDSRLSIFTVDYKESLKSFNLNRKVWAKVCRDAFKNGLTEPALKVVLGEGDAKTRLWIVGEHIIHDYIRLLNHVKELEEEIERLRQS